MNVTGKTAMTAGIVSLLVAGIMLVLVPTPTERVVEKVVERQVGAVVGPDIFHHIMSFNGLEMAFDKGSFYDASTTLIALDNPFNATSTAEMTISFTNGTTTLATLGCGTTTSQFPSSVSATLIALTDVSTSTAYYATSGDIYGAYPAGANTARAIPVGPDEYIACLVTNGNHVSGGVTGNSNTFSGTYRTLWKR